MNGDPFLTHIGRLDEHKFRVTIGRRFQALVFFLKKVKYKNKQGK